jgi:NAD(P)H-dependent flavin oxidoreductase YrpB (nitropropane dioxygenase family)
MSEADYSRDAFRKMRERQAAARQSEQQQSLLEQIQVDAEMDDATITVWNGQKFEAYDKWLAKRPVATEDRQETPKTKTEPKRAVEQIEQEGLWE